MIDQLPDASSGLIARIAAVTRSADRGDQKALAIIRKVFDVNPALWDLYGDLAAAAENALVDLWSADSALTSEGLHRRLAAIRAELAGTDATPLERLLAERVVASWLQSTHADYTYGRALNNERPPNELEFYQRRQDRAARQYLKALRSLADVRRLLLPTLQVNIAKRQVNIASAVRLKAAPARLARRSPGKRRRVGTGDAGPGTPRDIA